uniref:Dpy-19 like 4 n=1 Tax=Neogobius melanostomus TaxID=47308 RepID=A0A8C6STZ2_9GOBI
VIVPDAKNDSEDETDEQQSNDEEISNQESEASDEPERKSTFVQRLVRGVFGCVAAVACGVLYAAYLSAYHDRKFWFSARQELEREITFQAGSGMYYYYYKKMLAAPSFQRGFYELTADNRTVSGQTINAVERLSLYPELLTSLTYKLLECEPIYFYIGTVFGLQAVYVTALFISSWVLSRTWVAGMLAVAWYVINRPDTTRVDDTVPLRENWALPYFSCQVAALTGYLCNNISSATETLCYLMMSAVTFIFLLVWEHSHYVIFIQALCLFLLDSFDLVPPRKVLHIKYCVVCLKSLSIDAILSFSQMALHLLFGFQNMKRGPVIARIIKLFLHFYLVFTTNGFQRPGQDLFLRLTQASVLPFYFLVLAVCLLSTLEIIYKRLRGQPMKDQLKFEDGRIGEHPEVTYHVFHTLLFGGLALLFDGTKYLWTPYVCMFTAFGVCSPKLWMTLFKWVNLKSLDPVVLSLTLSTSVPTIICFSLWREYCPRVMSELVDLQEFYDPDTVELINWIKTQAPIAAVFAGSPQLLGTVKLCSGSIVTSLPLYSDISLLRRTEDPFQVYAMRSPEEVYKILTSQKTNYVIIEEAICNELSLYRGCRIKDLLDISNGHVVYDKGEMYSFSKHRRFCSEIKMNYSPYTNYFTRVFWNRSYHVYKVNSVISFQY